MVNDKTNNGTIHTGHINDYYDRVIAVIRDAASILIFGPGEAKGELKKLLEHAKFDGHLLAVEHDRRDDESKSPRKSVFS